MIDKEDIKHALLDVIQFHAANCTDEECGLLHSPVWTEIFNRLGITLTKEEVQTLAKWNEYAKNSK